MSAHTRDVLNKCSDGIYATGIEVSDNIEGKTYVFSDKNMMEAAIRNILSNAGKFTKKGGNIIICTQIVNTEGGEFYNISIKDSGIVK